MDAKEVKVPAVLLAIGMAIMVAAGFQEAGAEGATTVLMGIGIWVAILVAMGIVALFLVAAVLGLSFGPASHASLKLAAIFVFPAGIGMLLPDGFGWLVELVLYVSLLIYLFELEGKEVIFCMVVIWFVRWVAVILLAAIMAATLAG
jgi:hypothetical protein